MREYQEEYVRLVRSTAKLDAPSAVKLSPEEFVRAAGENSREARAAVRYGTALLRENLFPVLDGILSVPDGEADELYRFAQELLRGAGRDEALSYRIHSALLARARHRGDRDATLRELYYSGLCLYYLERMLSPTNARVYTDRMRSYFTECASWFDSRYDSITDPETRGYIHRSMGNIALAYDTGDPESSMTKLRVISRSIGILSDPAVRARTPSLPWDTFLFKSHQERTSLLSFLRSGLAGPEVFAQVLESAQIVQEAQLRTAREQGGAIQPRWQYTYLAARYHSGGMALTELLDALYRMSMSDSGASPNAIFCRISLPALYMNYARQLPEGKAAERAAVRSARLTRRFLSWLMRFPDSTDDSLLFYLTQFIYAYRESPEGMSAYDVLQGIFAGHCPTAYARMWIAGQIARELMGWAVEESPEALAGLPGFGSAEAVTARREELEDMALRAGSLYDIGMIHFTSMESSACRGLIEEEETLFRLHTECGAQILSRNPSTSSYADVALHHHAPSDASPLAPLTSIISAADALAASIEETSTRARPYVPFDTAADALLTGAACAPFVRDILRSEPHRAALCASLASWRHDAFLAMYRLRDTLSSFDE